MQRVGIFVVCLALFAGTISAQNPTMQQAMMSPAVGLMEAQTVAAGAIYEQDGVRITAFPVNHRPIGPAFGYRFDFGGRSVVISGDTVKSKSLTEAARGADLLFHDAK